MRISLVALLVAMLSWQSILAEERDPQGYEQILIPVYVGHEWPGANGSVWRTDLNLRNEGREPLQLFQCECCYFCSCALIGTCVPGRSLQPGDRDRQGFGNAGTRGVFLYVQKRYAGDLAGQLRVRDVSRSATSFGTEIPIVRERDFLTLPTHFLEVPLDSAFRQHLRIYGISSPTGDSIVRVRMYEADGDVPLVERIITLPPPNPFKTLPPATVFPTHPALAELVDFPALSPQLSGIGRVRVEVSPITPGLVFWAFITVTNNDTQHVTTITPQ